MVATTATAQACPSCGGQLVPTVGVCTGCRETHLLTATVGQPAPRPRHDWLPQEEAALRERWQGPDSAPAIAQAMGVSERAVRSRAWRLGLTGQPAPAPAATGQVLDMEPVIKIPRKEAEAIADALDRFTLGRLAGGNDYLLLQRLQRRLEGQ